MELAVGTKVWAGVRGAWMMMMVISRLVNVVFVMMVKVGGESAND